MNKRTKRYGGFLVGDRVKSKNGQLGTVKDMKKGNLIILFDKCSAYIPLMPNQVINLTQKDEERLKEINEELDRRHIKFYMDAYRRKIDKEIKEILGQKQIEWLNKGIFNICQFEMSKWLIENCPYEYNLLCACHENDNDFADKMEELCNREKLKRQKEENRKMTDPLPQMSEKTANELNEPIVAQIDENGKLCVAFKEDLSFESLSESESKRFYNAFNPKKDELSDIIDRLQTAQSKMENDCEEYVKKFGAKDKIVKKLVENCEKHRALVEEAKEYADTINKAQTAFADRVDEILSPNHPYPYNQNFSSTADF